MSPTLPIHPSKRHPLTGQPLVALALHPRTGCPVWPIMGGDDTVPPAGNEGDPQRPDGVSEDEWNALGDPGKRAIARERERAEAAERSLAAARQRPTPSKPQPPKGEDKPNGELDIAAIVQQAVEAAVKPFREAEERRQTQSAAEKITQSVIDAAKARLHDPTDALANIDLTAVVNDQGAVDETKVKDALDDLVKRKPHLAKPGERQAPPGIGGGAPAGATDADKVKAVLADMQRAAGVRLPAGTGTH